MRTEHPSILQLRSIASRLEGLDVACYRRHGRDPWQPLIGLGRPEAPWCFFGRDPGEQEVRAGKPFVGPAGARIRAVMHEVGLPDEGVFWMNTVPFKPLGNKCWPSSVQRECQPPLLDLMAPWRGHRVVTFGREAFHWFGIRQARDVRSQLATFWERADKYQADLEVAIAFPDGVRQLVLSPVPHPSGANAAWTKAFAGLLKMRLCGTSG